MNSSLIVLKKDKSIFGQSPQERTIKELTQYGIINLDKTKGPTSHQVADYVKKLLKINKAGHSGTLDPQVTGVQPIALGKAARITHFLLTAPKEYVGIMHLHQPVNETKLQISLKKFIGEITQLPPVKSAVKREKRKRKIYQLQILEIDKQDVLFKMKCQAGTYVRKFCIHPQTKIFTKNGLTNASDFYSNHSTIYSFNKGKMIKKNPSATQKIHSPSKLIKITMSSGISFIVTSNHELLTSKTTGYKMVEAQTLNEKDYLVKSLNFPDDSKELIIADLLDDYFYIQQADIKEKCKQALISKYGSVRAVYRELKLDRKTFLSKSDYAITIRHLKLAGIYEQIKKDIYTFKTQKGKIIKLKKLNEDFFYLLGLIASDGNNTKEKKTVRHTRIKFHNKNRELIEKFLETYKRIFPNISITKKKFGENLIEVDTSNGFLATIAASLGVKSPQKNSDISPIINVHPKLIKSFLKGYFDGDGSAYYKKRLNSTTHDSYIRFHTINHQDAINIHKMLLKVGMPNKIFNRTSILKGKRHKMYDVSLENISTKRKFIEEIGSNHPFKINKFKQILTIKNHLEIQDHYHISFHFKEEIKINKYPLHKMGGNINRVLTNNIPITRGFYKKASTIVKLPQLDEFIIEKIKSIKKVKGTDYVYDMTVPETHNFLIETGFVSSNCHDFGQELGVGAHMAELRRTQAGPFTEQDRLVTLTDLQDALHFYQKENNDKFLRYCLQPIENAIRHLPKCYILDSTITSLTHGRDLAIPGISQLELFDENETIAILTLKGELVAIGTSLMSTEKIKNHDKGLAIKVNKVFMEAL